MQDLIARFSLFGLAGFMLLFVIITWRLPKNRPDADELDAQERE